MSCDKSSSRAFPVTTIAIVASLTILASVGLPVRSFADPPGRVARIGYTSGSVSFRAGSLDEWSAATVNYPLTVGDHVWTDRNSRAELQIGSTIIRIAPSTEFSLLNLDDRTTQLRVTQGAVSVRVRGLMDDEVVEIDTPNSAVSVLQSGLYRVDVSEAGDSSDVVVRRGDAEVSAGGASFPLRAEQSAVLAGLDAPQPDIRGASPFDDFEAWCLTRDRTAENAQSARYVSRDMIGYEDLDANGSWQVVGAYGPVWFPRVRTEWVPYRYGHWVWVDLGGGPGSTTRRGALRRSTTDAGCLSRHAGRGCPARSWRGRCMPLRWSPLSEVPDGAPRFKSAARRSPGSRSARVKCSCPPIA